jgi:HEAT repeat protein
MTASAHLALSEILQSGTDIHRCAAARALGRTGARGAVETLCGALLDEDPDVRTDAAQALGEIGDPASASALMENLIGDPESDVKMAALGVLVRIGYAPVVPILRKLAVSRTPDIVWDEDEFYTEGWDSWLDLQLAAIRGLAKFGSPDAVQDILAAMGDEMGQDVSEIGVDALAAMGEDGAFALIELFPVSDPRLRRRIATAILRSDNPHLAPLVSQLPRDKQTRIREIAASGLDPADDRLEPLFNDPAPVVRAAAIRNAGAKFPDLVRALISDDDPLVRAEVFKVIAAFADLFPGEDLAKSVQKAISDDPGAAKQAAIALVALRGPKAAKGLMRAVTNPKVPLEFRLGAIEALEKAGSISTPCLLQAAASDERRIRLASLTALAGLAANDPVWPNAAGLGLLSALKGELIIAPEDPGEDIEGDDEGEGEGEADEDTGSVEGDNAHDIGAHDIGAHDIDETIPLVAIQDVPQDSTLGQIMSGGSDAPAAEQFAEKTPEQTAEQAPEPVELSEHDARLLELSKQRRMSKRKMSLESDEAPHLDICRFAASVLGGVPNRQVTDELIAVLGGEDGELHGEALASLAQHGETLGQLPGAALEPLLAQLGAEKSTTRVLAMRALGCVRDDACEAILRTGLSDDDPLVRVEAVRALAKRGIADADIENCLNDGYVGVRIAAATSLAQLRGSDVVEMLIRFSFGNDGSFRRDIGRLLGTHAREAALLRLTEFLQDDAYLRQRLVVIDALAEIFALKDPPEEQDAA